MEFTRDQVSQHNSATDAWLIIDGIVYDVTKFAAMHPGGELLLLSYAGKDVTAEFYALHRHEILLKYSKFRIGTIKGEKNEIYGENSVGAISRVPYAEPSYMQGMHSAYFKPTHIAFRKALRTFVMSTFSADATVFEEGNKPPSKEMYEQMGSFGLLASRIGPGQHLKLVPGLPGNVKPEEFDYFHEMIAHEEIVRLGTSGFSDGLGTGLYIGLPPVLHFGAEAIRQKIVSECLLGKKRTSLAISEPTAGSDVAAISATAVKSPCGKYYIVNGIKKWITNGTFSDYFVTAVRTGKKGMAGISMLLIERSAGVETKPIKTSYSSAAGTALVIFENVKVPVENLLGKENQGFKVIMYNFNHERWGIVCMVNRMSRMIVEECFKWSHQRTVFGKALVEQPVIRFKLAKMVAQVESVQNWLENITFQMTKMPYSEQSVKLAGPIALLKLLCTRVAHDVSDEACQIFGGRGITKTGMGRMIEMFQRTYKFGAILGGSEEIMADLGIKQAIASMPASAKL